MYMIIIIVLVLTLMMMMSLCSFGLGMSLLMIKEILRLSIISVAVLFSVEKGIISVDDVHSILLIDDFNFVYCAQKSAQSE